MAILPLFPELELLAAHADGGDIVVTLKNVGAFTICTRTYGQPEYRLIAKLFEGDVQVTDRWLALPCDLEPGATAMLRVPRVPRSSSEFLGLPRQILPRNSEEPEELRIKLYHALQDVPMLEPEPWSEVHVR